MDTEDFEWKKHHMSECGFTWHRPEECPHFEIKVRQKYDQTQDSTIFYKGSNVLVADLLAVDTGLVPYVKQFTSLDIKVEVEIIELV